MRTFDDLKNAILNVLKDATHYSFDEEWVDENGKKVTGSLHTVDTKLLQILQAEYNIYFVEPENEQVDLV